LLFASVVVQAWASLFRPGTAFEGSDTRGMRRMGSCLSLVIPAYDEADRLGAGLQRLMDAAPPDGTEIIVVDDGSTDGTADVAREILLHWPNHSVVSLPKNRGKGAAIRVGVARARGDAIGYVDADMGTDPKDLKLLLDALGRSHVAVGSRAHQMSVVKRDVHRRVMNRTFGMAVASMTRLPYMDTQCGFKAFRGPIAKLLWHGARIDRFAFDVEVLDLAVRFGLRMEEVPVNWVDVSGSKVRPVHDGLQMLNDVVRSRLIPKAVPPVPGILMRDVPIEAAPTLVRPFVRNVDLVIAWERGTAVLLPGMPPTAARRITNRLMAELEVYHPESLSVEYRTLFAPFSGVSIRPRELAV